MQDFYHGHIFKAAIWVIFMGRDIIAVDHDDTIQEYMRAFLKYRAETSGIHVSFEALTDYVFWPTVRYKSLEEARRDMRFFVQSSDAVLVPALPGAIDALQLLASRYDIVVI